MVDTVFVVADYVDWDLSNYRAQLKDVVPPEYFHATLEPIAYEMKVRDLSPSQTFRLYLGATADQPFDGMFSFFPCLPAQAGVWRVPPAAVTQINGRDVVLTVTKQGFRIVPVTVAGRLNDAVMVSGPLKAGDKVAATGVVAIKAAAGEVAP